jgi:hypothetical protein
MEGRKGERKGEKMSKDYVSKYWMIYLIKIIMEQEDDHEDMMISNNHSKDATKLMKFLIKIDSVSFNYLSSQSMSVYVCVCE